MVATFARPTSIGKIKRYTPNYGMPIPNFDGPGWGSAVEKSFDIVDAIMFALYGFGGIVGAWMNDRGYAVGNRVVDTDSNTIWEAQIAHTSPQGGTFEDDRTANPGRWTEIVYPVIDRTGLPLTVYDFATPGTPIGVGNAAADTAALKDFFDYITNNYVGSASWAGSWTINEEIFLGNEDVRNSITISIASPAVVTQANHGYANGQVIRFQTSGVMPTGVNSPAGTAYVVQNATANTYNIALTDGGALINTSGTQSGDHISIVRGANCLTEHITGLIKLTPTVALDNVFHIDNCPQVNLDAIRIVGGNNTSWAGRTCGNGVVLRNSGRTSINSVYCDYLRGYAVVVNQRPGENVNTCRISIVKAYHCGSGKLSAGNPVNLTATFTGYTHPVTADNTTQRTRLTAVSAFPPDSIIEPFLGATPLSNVGIGHVFVMISGKLYQVMAIDQVAGTIDIHPRLAPYGTMAGTLDWVFGGAASVRGSDANNIRFDQIDASSCGIALSDGALYGAECGLLQAQGFGVGWAFGIPLTSSSQGGLVENIYLEGDGLFEIVQTTSVAATGNFHTLLNYKVPLNFSKFVNLTTSLKNADELPVVSLHKLDGLMFPIEGRYHTFENLANNGSETFSAVNVDMSIPDPMWLGFDTKNLLILAAKTGLNAVTGRQGKSVEVMGTGTGFDHPTGSIFFVPPGTAKVNNLPRHTATISIASPAVVTATGHGFADGQAIRFSSTGATPTGATVATNFFVKLIDANTFNFSATQGGANVNTSGTQSGVHTVFGIHQESNFSGPASFMIYHSVVADNYKVRRINGGRRATGWGAPTGTATRTTFDTATVTLPQLAERVKAMIDDLRSANDFST